MVHGTAGSAAIALLIMATIDEPAAGMLYLLLFGAGTIAGMIAVTGLMTIPMTMIADKRAGRRWLTAASGLVSLAFGVFMVHALGGPLVLFAAGPSF